MTGWEAVEEWGWEEKEGVGEWVESKGGRRREKKRKRVNRTKRKEITKENENSNIGAGKQKKEVMMDGWSWTKKQMVSHSYYSIFNKPAVVDVAATKQLKV